MRELIDREKLIEYMQRVLRHMEAELPPGDHAAFLRGYRSAIAEVETAPRVPVSEAAQ